MARRTESSIVAVSETGYSVYLRSELTTDYQFPFDPGDDVRVCIVPHVGLVIVPADGDGDERIERLLE